MRGSRQPAIKHTPSESQNTFRSFARGRRSKLAARAQTTLVKADQWARGEAVEGPVAETLDGAVAALKAKKK